MKQRFGSFTSGIRFEEARKPRFENCGTQPRGLLVSGVFWPRRVQTNLQRAAYFISLFTSTVVLYIYWNPVPAARTSLKRENQLPNVYRHPAQLHRRLCAPDSIMHRSMYAYSMRNFILRRKFCIPKGSGVHQAHWSNQTEKKARENEKKSQRRALIPFPLPSLPHDVPFFLIIPKLTLVFYGLVTLLVEYRFDGGANDGRMPGRCA